MANKFHTYFGQILTDSELNEIHASLFDAIDRFVQDFGYRGIAFGGAVTQHTPNNLTVDLAPSVVYDQTANRTEFGSPVVVNCALDENGAATAVSSGGNQKWLSLFLEATSTPTDPRTDDLGNTVYFKDVAGYQVNVVQGSQAPTGTAVRPALRGDQILMADVLISFGTTAIVNANISSTRSQVIFDISGTPVSVRGKALTDVITQLVASINAAIAAMDVDLAAAIAAIDVDTLAADAVPGSPIAISAGNVHSIFLALLNAINTLRTDVNGITAIYARTNAANTFTQKQTIDVIDASVPLLTTTKSPSDDSHGGNQWMLLEQWGNTRIFYGLNAGAATGGFAIVYNARWVPASPNGHWEPVTTSQGAAFLSFNYGNLYYTAVRANTIGGPATWTDWPDFATSDRGDMFLGRDVHAKGLFATGDVTLTGEVRYLASKQRTTAIPLIGAPGLVDAGSGGYTMSLTETVRAPLGRILPHGMMFDTLEFVHFKQTSGAGTHFYLKKRTVNWAAPAAYSITTVGTLTPPSSSGYRNDPMTFTAEAFDSQAEYYLEWDEADAADQLIGVRIKDWVDVGPQGF